MELLIVFNRRGERTTKGGIPGAVKRERGPEFEPQRRKEHVWDPTVIFFRKLDLFGQLTGQGQAAASSFSCNCCGGAHGFWGSPRSCPGVAAPRTIVVAAFGFAETAVPVGK